MSELLAPAYLRICQFSHWIIKGTRERHLESILQSSFAQIILVKSFPRSLIQIVLQVEESPENEYVNTKLVQASLVSLILSRISALFLLF